MPRLLISSLTLQMASKMWGRSPASAGFAESFMVISCCGTDGFPVVYRARTPGASPRRETMKDVKKKLDTYLRKRDGSVSRSGKAMTALSKSTGYSVDRKSTRLNSSHVAISYAVFCL